jgi:signal transduction histidine kinase/CheY-like chemotaxis protein
MRFGTGDHAAQVVESNGLALAEPSAFAALRVATALNAAVSQGELGAVVTSAVARELSPTLVVCSVRGDLVALDGVPAPDDLEAHARSLDALTLRWEQGQTGWLTAPMLAVLPLVTGGTRHGTLVLGFDQVSEPVRELAEKIAGLVAVACERIAAYEEAVADRARAEAAAAEHDRVLGHLAHELRNPLSPILTATQLMGLRAPDVAVKERSTIERNATRLVHLVDDLLEATRLARGQLHLEREPLALSGAVDRAIEIATPYLAERGHSVAATISPLLVVNIDREQLAHAIAQLLANAAKYSDAGCEISVTAAREGESVALRVSDCGAGIPPELIEKIFDPYVQGSYGQRRGLGIGLAIARGIAELHGGTLVAASEGPGRGSTFTLALPRWQPKPVAEEMQSVAGPSDRRILVVDDNQDAAWLLAEALRMLGHDVRISHDGAAALELARQWEPHIAFLDIGLPTLDGFQLCEAMRRLPRPPHCVAVTGYGAQRDRERARTAGFVRHFTKPVDLRDVKDVIDHFAQA